MLNLIKHQRRVKVGIKSRKNPKAFIDYSQTVVDVYEKLEEYNSTKKRKVFIDMTADMEANKKLSTLVSELFIRGRKLIISIVFISQSSLKVPKIIRLNTTHYFIMKILNKRELQQIASNHLSDIDFKDFMELYKDYSKKTFSFLASDATLPQDNPLRFWKNLL